MAIEINCGRDLSYTKSEFPNAYLKVENVVFKTERKMIWFDVVIYADKTARETKNAITIYKRIFQIPMQEFEITTLDKLHEAVYNYVKNMPDFQGIDC